MSPSEGIPWKLGIMALSMNFSAQRSTDQRSNPMPKNLIGWSDRQISLLVLCPISQPAQALAFLADTRLNWWGNTNGELGSVIGLPPPVVSGRPEPSIWVNCACIKFLPRFAVPSVELQIPDRLQGVLRMNFLVRSRPRPAPLCNSASPPRLMPLQRLSVILTSIYQSIYQ